MMGRACRKASSSLILVGLLGIAQGQWLNYPAPGTPRTRDGKPNLSAPTPRANNGKPDLSGVWEIEPPVPGEIERLMGNVFQDFVVPGDDPRTFSKYFFNILADVKPEDAPLKPATAELMRRLAKAGPRSGPETRCLPVGIPRSTFLSVPFKIVQTPSVVIMIYEADNMHRQVYLDGRKLPVDPTPSWMGYSVGRWENGTLLVDSAGFNDRSPLDAMGHPRSEAFHMTERFRRRDFGHMEVAMTVDDPQTYTRPFSIRFNLVLLPDTDVLETICEEDEKDARHLPNP